MKQLVFLTPPPDSKAAGSCYKSEDVPSKAEMHVDEHACYVNIVKCLFERNQMSYFVGLNDNLMVVHQ
jgi:hypothetical protein